MVWEAQRGGHRQHQEYRYTQPNLMDFMPHTGGGAGTAEDQIRAMDAILGSYPQNLLSTASQHLGAESLLAGAASAGGAAPRQAMYSEATLSSLLAANAASARSAMLPESIIRSALSAGNIPTNTTIPQPGALWGLGGPPSAGSSEMRSALSMNPQQLPSLAGTTHSASSMLSSSPALMATLRAAAGAERQEQAAALEAALVAEANRRGRMEAMRMAAEINNPEALFSTARDQSSALSRIAREGGLDALTASSRSIQQQQETTNRHNVLSAQQTLLADTLDPLLAGLSRQQGGDIMPSALLDSRLNPLRGMLGSGTGAGNTLASIAGRLSGSTPEDPLRVSAYSRSAATRQALLLEAAERQRVANASTMLNSQQRASLLSAAFNQPRGGLLGDASALQLLERFRNPHSGITTTATSGASLLSARQAGGASLKPVDATVPIGREEEASGKAPPGKSPDERHRR